MIAKLARKLRQNASERREKKKTKTRSPRWASVRDAFMAKCAACAACGKTERLQVHHVVPFNEKPEMELDESNLMVLCMGDDECHLFIGHGGNYDFWNPEVRLDVEELKKGKEARLVKDAAKKRRKPNDPTKD